MSSRRVCNQIAQIALSLSLALSLSSASQGQVLGSNLVYTSIQPCRVFDTRFATNGTNGQFTANVAQTFNVIGGNVTPTYFTGQGGNNGGCHIPGFAGYGAKVQAVVFNVVVVSPSSTGFLQGWPSDQPKPNASLVNFTAAEGAIANGIVVPVRQDQAGGDITLVSSVAAHVLADVVGYFSSYTPGNSNTALGGSLGDISSGHSNTAVGDNALPSITNQSYNAALGEGALFGLNSPGDCNVGIGEFALGQLVSGFRNIGVGPFAGNNTTSGDYNIYIGSLGSDGSGTEFDTIRIGNPAIHRFAFIAGISGAGISSGSQVFVSSSGQLGTITSSLRFKEDVRDMGDASDDLMALRPVTFYYKPSFDDGSRLLQYGLIAEEVAKVYPGLVQYAQEWATLKRSLSLRQCHDAQCHPEAARQDRRTKARDNNPPSRTV